MADSIQLTSWQKKQAVLLYHFASLDYLKGLQKRLNDLMMFIDPTLDLAKAQDRDLLLVSKQWGNRNPSENWANNAWPFLKDFQLSIAKHIANRALEIYCITGANQCGRGMDEISMAWSTPEEEEEKFHEMFESLATYARYIDNTMNKNERAGKWNDFRLAVTWQQFKDQFHALPKFRVRTDVVGESNKLPMRTGVYISQDDPNGALQFAWAGGTEEQLPIKSISEKLFAEVLRIARVLRPLPNVFFVFLFIYFGTAQAHTTLQVNNQDDWYIYSTKFGDLKFIKDSGSLGSPANKLTLSGQFLLQANTPKDQNDYRPSFMSAHSFPGGEQSETASKKQNEKLMTNRLIVLEGEDGNCIRQLIILDFTNEKPFVSERFGYNPDGKACLKFIRAKWGKKESYIYLEGPMKYVYYTGGRVIGPID
jgi:hypothetical protein